ncbi:MAG TPA: hypothetical protein VFG62_24650 [Rhodopila sp.]|jgi:hypothetical protein|nr:hypothetical protein [Rhodopila sp.]
MVGFVIGLVQVVLWLVLAGLVFCVLWGLLVSLPSHAYQAITRDKSHDPPRLSYCEVTALEAKLKEKRRLADEEHRKFYEHYLEIRPRTD